MKNHYDILQEFILVFFIIDYKYYGKLLYIFQYNDSDI